MLNFIYHENKTDFGEVKLKGQASVVNHYRCSSVLGMSTVLTHNCHLLSARHSSRVGRMRGITQLNLTIILRGNY